MNSVLADEVKDYGMGLYRLFPARQYDGKQKITSYNCRRTEFFGKCFYASEFDIY